MTDLSPAAQAIMNGNLPVYDEDHLYALTEKQHAAIIAAAVIETLADQVTPANGSRRNNEIRADILAIAAKLRGTTTEIL